MICGFLSDDGFTDSYRLAAYAKDGRGADPTSA